MGHCPGDQRSPRTYSPSATIIGPNNPRRSITKIGQGTTASMSVGLDQIQNFHHEQSHPGASSCLKRSGTGPCARSIVFRLDRKRAPEPVPEALHCLV